ncbi:hypothetical protein SUGI_1195640 [Cryptomeria japonica]|nr:hypothetical protein SUGI_1195640 [Cryptomeria japonica]
MVLGILGLLLLLPIICCSACLEKERIALLDFKQGINFTFYREYSSYFVSPPLESWRGLNCCAWEGVRCHPHTRHVLTFDLTPTPAFQLLHFEHLDLSGNLFNSLSIPPQIGELKRLKYLSLRGWEFTGQIPRELTKLQQLEHLDLSFNNLHGVIPRELTKLQQLEHLDLGANNLHGVIPREIGNMSTLKYLRLSLNNDLQSNKLEEWITHLRGLEQLRLGYVNFSMAGDSWVGNIASLTNLTVLLMYGCGLTGEIPPSFANLSGLQALRLSTNSLRGNIPAFLGALPLVDLDLSDNNLEGSLPSSLSGLSKLEYLELSSNRLNGSIPSTLGNLSALGYLEMENNSFSGPIPISFAKLSNLELLYLANNSLNGTFSFFILNNCPKLTLVDLSSNMLTVKISASTIPNFQLDFLGLRQWSTFYIDAITIKNKGQDLEYKTILRLVKCLDLSNNSLSGIIPWNIGSLKGLIILNISRNHFNGKIPKSIGEMQMLQSLDLSQNNLSGAIPTELQLLTSLSYFDVSYNNLSGLIPQGAQMATFDSRYFSNNSGLCGFQVNTSCSRGHPNFSKAHETNKDLDDDIWWNMGMATGYVISFSIVMGMLWVNKTWSVTCCKIMDAIIIYVFEILREKL